MAEGLSERAQRAVGVVGHGEPHPATAPAEGLIDSLRHHLHAGETHYPVRPGMPELRARVDARLVETGLPERGPDGVLITASEGESMFVTLLGLGIGPQGSLEGPQDGPHAALLAWLGVTVTDVERDAGLVAYRDAGSDTRIVSLGAALFRERLASIAERLEPEDVLIGSLDGLQGMMPFRLGFVAAAPEVVKGITKWKQASSICAPGPSQRAALWALEVRP